MPEELTVAAVTVLALLLVGGGGGAGAVLGAAVLIRSLVSVVLLRVIDAVLAAMPFTVGVAAKPRRARQQAACPSRGASMASGGRGGSFRPACPHQRGAGPARPRGRAGRTGAGRRAHPEGLLRCTHTASPLSLPPPFHPGGCQGGGVAASSKVTNTDFLKKAVECPLHCSLLSV